MAKATNPFLSVLVTNCVTRNFLPNPSTCKIEKQTISSGPSSSSFSILRLPMKIVHPLSNSKGMRSGNQKASRQPEKDELLGRDRLLPSLGLCCAGELELMEHSSDL